MRQKVVVLLITPDSGPYLEAIDQLGLAQHVEVYAVAAEAALSSDMLASVDVLLALAAPPGILAQMPRLKWIQSVTVGVDGWLARPDLKPEQNIVAARGAQRIQMPEIILGALFHITKPFTAAAFSQRDRRWVRHTPATLAGSTLGIIGLGAIGQELARKATALEMEVIGTRRTLASVEHVAEVFPPCRTDEVLARSHFVVLLLPLVESTQNFMDQRRISQMRSDAWLLNFGRGALVVDDDLVEAVSQRRIAGAILDVFRNEPLPADHQFWHTPGISVLPHIGGLHRERDKIVAQLFAENLREYLTGRPLPNVVDRARGY